MKVRGISVKASRRLVRLRRLWKTGCRVMSWIVIGIVGLIVLRLFLLIVVFDTFHTPTESMTPTLLPDDCGYIDKLKLGGRIFDIYAAAEGREFEVRRLPGYGKLERGDVIVFNTPFVGSWDRVAMNMYQYYCKRAVAVAGDTLEICHGFYKVRGCRDVIGVRDEQRDLHAAVSRVIVPSTCYDSLPGWVRVFPYDHERKWTVDEMGPLVIPEDGTKIRLDSLNLLTYRKYIEWETDCKTEWRDGAAWIDGDRVTWYTFCENYCFAAGDHVIDSQDSRYWGLVPEKFVVGVARFVWKSKKGMRML